MVRVNKGYKVKVHIAVDRITSSLTTVANVLDYAALPLSWRDDSLPNGYRARKSTQDDQKVSEAADKPLQSGPGLPLATSLRAIRNFADCSCVWLVSDREGDRDLQLVRTIQAALLRPEWIISQDRLDNSF